MMDKIKLCFLGCGNICEKHAKTIHKLNQNIEFSFASRSQDKARSLVEKYKGKHGFASYEEALSHKDIDTIMITTPPDSHYSLALSALNNGKHVIIEKPPVHKSEELRHLGKIADENNLKLLIAENYFYRPIRKELSKILKENLIGQVVFFNINATKTQQNNGDWREDQKTALYGALFEGGIHWINFINNIGFSITHVTGFQPNPNLSMEKSFQATFETKENTIINLFYSWEIKRIINGISKAKIYGTHGSITFEINGLYIFVNGKKLKLIIPKLSHITGFKPMFNDFFSAIRSGKDASFTWHMALQDLILIEKLYQSSNK